MKKLLIVDDEKDILKLYEKEFSEEGYQVMLAQSGEEALRIAQTDDINLVILDIKMKGKDGLETLGELRKNNKARPIILNSAYSTYKGDFQSWLADAYVVKSPDLTSLKKRVKSLLNF